MPFSEWKMGGGLNQKATPDAIADNELQEAIACRFDTLGSVASERGRSELEVFTAAEIRGIHTSYRSGSRKRLLKAGTTVYEDTTSLGTFTGAGYLSGSTYRGLDYLVDGTTQAVWDGNTLYTKIGLDAPTTALTLTAYGSGGALQTGTYEVVYTWVVKRDDGSDAVETNFSPVTTTDGSGKVDVTSAGSVGRIELSGFESAPARATHIRIYRTLPNKKNYFFDQEIDADSTSATVTNLIPDTKGDTSTSEATLVTQDITEQPRAASTAPNKPYVPFRSPEWVQDRFKRKGQSSERAPQIMQTNLGLLADWTDHDPAPTGLKHITSVNQQLIGMINNDIVFSRPGEPEHWSVFNRFTIGRNTGETLQTILPLGGSVIAYTDSNIYRVDLVNLSYEDIRVIDMRSPVGACGEWAVTDITLGGQQVHLFMAKTGLYIFDGQSVTEVSYRIEGLFNGEAIQGHSADIVSQEYADLVRAASYRDRAWFSYPAGATNNRTLMVDFQEPDNPKFSVTRYGYTALYREHETGLILGGDTGGSLYQVDIGESDAGDNIQWTARTKEFPLGSSNAMVSIESAMIDADLGGYDTFFNVVMDNGRNAAFIIAATAQTDGRHRYVVEVPNYMKGNRASVRIESVGTQSRKLFGVGFNYREEGVPTP